MGISCASIYNCNNNHSDNNEYLMDESFSMKHDASLKNLMSNVQNVQTVKNDKTLSNEDMINSIELINLVKKLQRNFRIFYAFKKNRDNNNKVKIWLNIQINNENYGSALSGISGISGFGNGTEINKNHNNNIQKININGDEINTVNGESILIIQFI